MVHDHGRAEDITQDVFVSALRRMRATDVPIAFKPWLYEIAKNACIDAFRRSRRAEEVSFDADDGGDRIALASTGPTPDAAVDTRMSLDHLRGAFGGLSEAHHQILVMRELEGLSYREIGERLGMSRPSVESTLFRARRRLTEEYEELVSGERCQRIQTLIAGSSGGQVGSRDERKMARHVSHCQPCRRAAFAAGFDLADLTRPRSVREKLAALLPLPAFLRKRILGGHGDHGSLWSTAAHYAEPASGGWMKAAAAVAALALVGVGADRAQHHGGAPARSGQPAPASSSSSSGHARSTSTIVNRSGGPTAAGGGATSAVHGSKVTTPARGSSGRSGGAAPSSGGGGSTQSSGSGSSSSTGAAAGSGGPASGVGGLVNGLTRQLTGGSGSGGGSGVNVQAPQVPPVQLPKVQVPTVQLPTVPGAPPAVNNTVGTVNHVVSGATNTVNTTVGKVTDTVNQTTPKVTGTVNQTTSAATSTVNTTVNGTTQTATNTVNNVTGTVGKLLGGG